MYADGVNKQRQFSVVDYTSSYNMIIDRPWIHDMGAIPSTLHQSIKFPTVWGVKEIKIAQENSCTCYQTTLKGNGECL